MFGNLIASLDDPAVARGVLAALDDPALSARVTAWAEVTGYPSANVVAVCVRHFLDAASDDHWTQLIGIMSRAEDPGLAAVRAILVKVLPEAEA
ncbi:hypothetical protein [Nitrospirillum iridis]|uniref:Uncharacterized protein n=1 Tax=Nitrospirillum iridis TaxID=765888 RepID=A0A7X0B0G9_9PROT|nr:hypothetical protein [Nitrospirillum iridis]MBB6252096.1 hypothetical protein [Nitrospirillum iridis]